MEAVDPNGMLALILTCVVGAVIVLLVFALSGRAADRADRAARDDKKTTEEIWKRGR